MIDKARKTGNGSILKIKIQIMGNDEVEKCRCFVQEKCIMRYKLCQAQGLMLFFCVWEFYNARKRHEWLDNNHNVKSAPRGRTI